MRNKLKQQLSTAVLSELRARVYERELLHLARLIERIEFQTRILPRRTDAHIRHRPAPTGSPRQTRRGADAFFFQGCSF